jgi:hypothetical protein
MQWLLVIVLAVLALVVVGALINLLKWLLIIAAVVVVVGLAGKALTRGDKTP